MIRSLKHRGLRQAFEHGNFRYLPPEYREKIRAILAALDVAAKPEEVDAPRHRMHQLTGDRRGLFAIQVSANWRIVFRFQDGDVHEVDFEDYH